MTKLDASDVGLLRAAASVALHAPERMRAAHLAPRLERLADRLQAEVAEPATDAPAAALRAA